VAGTLCGVEAVNEYAGDLSEIAKAWRIVNRAARVVVLVGAGISTDSGIPDFRGPQGVWTKNPAAEKMATIDNYVNDPEVRERAWQNRLHSPTWDARPNPGHFALIELERRGVLDLIVTQNIDGLHQRAGQDPSLVVEIHGTMHEIVCLRCGDRQPTAPVLERVAASEPDPSCTCMVGGRVCGGILKTATISFGQDLVVEDLRRAERAAESCDVMLAVGSTLSVYPAAALVPTAKRAGAAVVIVNAEPTAYDPVADAVVRTPISEALGLIVAESPPEGSG
jgi:NAD-dependent deacetylase